MKATVRLYGQLVDIFHKEELGLDLEKTITIRELIETRLFTDPSHVLPKISVAVNNQMTKVDSLIQDGDIIDIMPPFAGG